MDNFSPDGDNLMYEMTREYGLLNSFRKSLIDFPRRTIQITCGAQAREAKAYAQDIVKDGATPRVIYRIGDDDNIHKFATKEKQLERLIDHAKGGLIPSWNNEPDTSAESLRKMKEDGIWIMERLHALGIRAVMINLSTGAVDNIEKFVPPDLIEFGEACVRFGHWLGTHTYLNTIFFDWVVGKQTYAGRERYLLAHVPGLKFINTEYGFDSHAPNPQLHGWKKHIDKWRELFPGVDPEVVYWRETLKVEQVHHAELDIDRLHYSFGCDPKRCDGWDKDVPRPFDYAHALTIQRLKNSFRRQRKETPVTVEIVRIKALPDGITFRNIRTQPNGTAEDVGDVRAGYVVQLTLPQVNQWVRVKVTNLGGANDDVGKEGWVFMQGVKYESFTAPVEEPPKPPSPPAPLPGRALEVDLPPVLYSTPEIAEANAQLFEDIAAAIRGQAKAQQ